MSVKKEYVVTTAHVSIHLVVSIALASLDSAEMEPIAQVILYIVYCVLCSLFICYFLEKRREQETDLPYKHSNNEEK